MEQITGRIVKDAEIKRTNGGKELVAFSVAINDYYKPKNGEVQKKTRFFNCAYFVSTKVATALKQGSIVSLFGRVDINAYTGADGKHHASLAFFANHIDIISVGKKDEAASNTAAGITAA